MPRRVYMMPTPTQATHDVTNSINQIVLKLERSLEEFGWEITEDLQGADIIAGHAGQTNRSVRVDVAITHGLYPTDTHDGRMFRAANAHVLNNIRDAFITTAPSEWVADIYRREFHIEPRVIGWAIDPEIWKSTPSKGYTLWNKTREGGVCDPKPIQELAEMLPDVPFVSTFGKPAKNLRIIGRVPFPAMQKYIEEAHIYLATTRETFGISTLEAMASGVPVLGYNWSATADIVEHGVTGYLAKPNDLDDLLQGWKYCNEHRDILGANGIEVALQYSWRVICEQFAEVFNEAYDLKHNSHPVAVSVVVPCHNYARYLPQALDSIVAQETSFDFEVLVVDDASTDETEEVASQYTEALPALVSYYRSPTNIGVANARNAGIRNASGEFVVCLDADDRLGGPDFLQKLYDTISKDRRIGIVYGKLGQMVPNGQAYKESQWPGAFSVASQVRGSNQVPSCNMFRREAWRRAGGYRWYMEPSEDANLWTRMMGLGYEVEFVPDAIYLYRMHDQSLSAPIRLGEAPSVNWRQFLTWVDGVNVPLGYIGDPSLWSWPVRDYDQPDISIVVPVGAYHSDELLHRALDSIEGQTHPYWECIVVNDTGRSLDMNGYAWAKVVSIDAGSGPSKARNVGVDKSSAPLVAFLDADDYMLPTFLEKTIEAFRTTGKYAYTDWYSINKQGNQERHSTPEYDPNEVFKRTSIHSINVLIPRTWLTQVGGFDEAMRTWEDVDLFMKLAASGLCGVRVPEPLIVYDYQTGQLRENGEEIKPELKSMLAGRFGEYIGGNKVCGCIEDKIKRSAAPKIETASSEQVVRVRFKGGTAKIAVRGLETGTNYGRRRDGDIFYVFKEDQRRSPNIFVPIGGRVEIPTEPTSTAAPVRLV